MTPAEIDALLVEPMARAICRAEHILKYGADVWRPGELDLKVKGYWEFHVPAAMDALAAQRATLDANSLFIGPEVATGEMIRAAANAWPDLDDSTDATLYGGLYQIEVAAWQRDDGP